MIVKTIEISTLFYNLVSWKSKFQFRNSKFNSCKGKSGYPALNGCKFCKQQPIWKLVLQKGHDKTEAEKSFRIRNSNFCPWRISN